MLNRKDNIKYNHVTLNNNNYMKNDERHNSHGLFLLKDSSCLEEDDSQEIYQEIRLIESEEYVFLQNKK